MNKVFLRKGKKLPKNKPKSTPKVNFGLFFSFFSLIVFIFLLIGCSMLFMAHWHNVDLVVNFINWNSEMLINNFCDYMTVNHCVGLKELYIVSIDYLYWIFYLSLFLAFFLGVAIREVIFEKYKK